MRVLVAAGGTAGHLAPALAVADSLREGGCHVEFAVSAGRADEATASARGYRSHAFAISGIPRRPGLQQLRALLRAGLAVPRCMRIIRQVRADALLAGGGFVCAPAAVAAWLLRVPVVVTEADAHLGLANRVAARFARRLCTAYPLAHFRLRQTVTGRPVDPSFGTSEQGTARAALGIPAGERAVAVVGGSGGATRLNESTFAAWGQEAEPRVGGLPLRVLHVAGRRDHGDLAARERASERYVLIEYCEDMPTLLSAADLVVTRAGGSIWELAAVGRAALLVPFPHATGDHQRRNARWFCERGAAICLEDDECTPERLREEVERLLEPSADAARDRLAAALRSLARPDAAADIAAIVRQVAEAHRRRLDATA